MSGLPDLRGKVAVVTGGASGIGKGIAAKLRAEGMRVVIADIEQDVLRETAAAIDAVGVPVDVSDLESVQGLAKEATARFGTVHVVCNNAGIGPLAQIADLTMDDWHWMIGVNLYGVIHGVQTFLPILRANPDGGHIVNTASMAGLVAPVRLGAYSVTKYGVVALTEVLAAELAAAGSKVGASVLCPGTVRTSIGTSSRNRPEHMADGGLTDVDIEKARIWTRTRHRGHGAPLAGAGARPSLFGGLAWAGPLLGEDLGAQPDALGADVHAWPGDQPETRGAQLATEGAGGAGRLAAPAAPLLAGAVVDGPGCGGRRGRSGGRGEGRGRGRGRGGGRGGRLRETLPCGLLRHSHPGADVGPGKPGATRLFDKTADQFVAAEVELRTDLNGRFDPVQRGVRGPFPDGAHQRIECHDLHMDNLRLSTWDRQP